MKATNQNNHPKCTVTLVFPKENKDDVRKQIAEMLLNAWKQRMEEEIESSKKQ